MARVLRVTVADLRAARRVFRPPLHVVRARHGRAGRGADYLGLEALLVWLTAAMGGALDPEMVEDLKSRRLSERELDSGVSP